MQIEKATIEDARGIAEVHVESWRVAYAGIVPPSYLAALSVAQREDSWKRQLLDGTPHILVARAAHRIVGFIAFGACRDAEAPSTHGEIWALYVLPSHWSAGTGTALCRSALEMLGKLGFAAVSLWVLSSNRRGIGFYETLGFTRVPDSEKMFVAGGEEIAEVLLVRSAVVDVDPHGGFDGG
jgi:ribosomal protein S18 acetylase RimI-like enzyme